MLLLCFEISISVQRLGDSLNNGGLLSLTAEQMRESQISLVQALSVRYTIFSCCYIVVTMQLLLCSSYVVVTM